MTGSVIYRIIFNMNDTITDISKEVNDYYEKGICAIKRGNYDYAVELFGSALALKQNFAEARYYLWLALWEKLKKEKDPVKLKAFFRKIAALFPLLKSVSLRRAGKRWEAIYLLEKAMKIDPSNTKILDLLADCLLKERLTDNAVKMMEAIPIIDNKNYKAFKKLGKLYRDLDNYEKARAYFLAALRINPNDMETDKAIKDLDALKTIRNL